MNNKIDIFFFQQCSVRGCDQSYCNVHPFPSNSYEIRTHWANALNINVGDIDSSFRICDQHFTDDNYAGTLIS